MSSVSEENMKEETNFDAYLEDQLKDRAFTDLFRKAGDTWDVEI